MTTPTDVSTRRSGARLDQLAELEEERRFLLRSLSDLEREHDAGDVDDDDYETLKDGYTVRAAHVLRRIEDGRRSLAPKPPRDWKRVGLVLLVVALATAGIGVALANAFGEREPGGTGSGFTPGDDTRTILADARLAMNRGDFARANDLFVQADQRELETGNENAEARAYVGWTFALLARAEGESPQTDERLALSLLALQQAIEIDPTFADPYCFAAIIEFRFRGDAEAALPFVETCEELNPPADVRDLVAAFATEIREAAA